MHSNPFRPNILHDKRAAANGVDLRNGQRIARPNGGIMIAPTAKRHLVPRKDYRHCADAQVYDASGKPI